MKIDVNIPDGKRGEWSVQTFNVPEKDSSQIISLMKTGRGVPAGTYKRLVRNDCVVMSNTPDEINDFTHFTSQAKGSVLINGLGLGVVVMSLLDNNDVTEITIIEKSLDVIGLVAKHIKHKRADIVEVLHRDAFEYKPPKGKRYNAVWHDIWDYISEDNIPEMTKLHRKYGKRCDYQESWCKDECLRLRRKNNNHGRGI